MIQTWRLDTEDQTLVLGNQNKNLACVIYWGPNLPQDADLQTLWHTSKIDVTGGMLDANPDLSICPEASKTFPGQAGLIIRDNKGDLISTQLEFEKFDSTDTSLILNYSDEENGLTYSASFIVYKDTNIIATSASITATNPVHLEWLAAPVMPAPQSATQMIDYTGRWCGEFQEVYTNWSAGMRVRESRTGRTGHEHFPALIVPEIASSYTKGSARAFHYGWSGGHKMIAEELPDGRRQVQFGNASNSELEAGKHFETGELYLTYSNNGTNGCARAYQRHVRKHIVTFPDPDRPRPVHYNCWEAVYFNHKLSELMDIATRAAKLGAERFVLDDGWFGTRDDDTRSLSEWEVDPRKYPEGLTPLIDHVHGEGMHFGIWFEPEMINRNSTLYETNPHWALGYDDQTLGRHQKVLNMALPEVQDYLFNSISKILNENAIDYVKWDHNRVLPSPDAAQARGTYALIDRLRDAFPKVEIESCASGGGRIDFEILKRTHRVWLSDSNDALERARIQHGSAMFLPASITGSHVGPRTSKTSGRTHTMAFRAWIAAQRHMGFEMDPRELTDKEAATLTRVTSWWREERAWLMQADILRLDSNDPAVLGEIHISDDEQQFVVFANKIDTSLQIAPRPLRLTGLNANQNYHIELVNRDELHELSRGEPALKMNDITLSGQYLMYHGITLPWSFPEQTWVIKGKLQN